MRFLVFPKGGKGFPYQGTLEDLKPFHRTIDRWSKTPIKLLEAPRDEAYGRVAVVADAYGNRWDVFDEAYETNA